MFLNPFQPELRGILTRFHKLFAFLRCEVRPFFVRFALGTQPEMDTHLSDDSVSKSYQREGQPRKTENEFSHDRLTMIHRESDDSGNPSWSDYLLIHSRSRDQWHFASAVIIQTSKPVYLSCLCLLVHSNFLLKYLIEIATTTTWEILVEILFFFLFFFLTVDISPLGK